MRRTFYVCVVLLIITVSLYSERIDFSWVQEYDYHTPANIISPITMGMGGINLTNAGDYFAANDNPALLADNTGSAAATSFIIKQDAPATFAQLMNANNLLKDKQFMYYSVITKQAAWSYQPMASVHISEFTSTGSNTYREYFDYQIDKLQLSLAGKDDEFTKLAGGVNLKYLTGRLVKLTERYEYGDWVTQGSLIDDKVKGVSGDIGLTWQEGDFIWGSCIYDIYSRLWWENYESESLKRRIATGFQYNMDNLALLGGIQGRVAKYPETTYHLGLLRSFTWGAESSVTDTQVAQQNLLIRAGLYSKDFNGTQNISYTLGSGYNYNMFRIDFSLTNSGMQLKDSQYLFSVGVGLQQ
jgi:hypothetical protein